MYVLLILQFTATVLLLSTRFLDTGRSALAVPSLLLSNAILFYKLSVRNDCSSFLPKLSHHTALLSLKLFTPTWLAGSCGIVKCTHNIQHNVWATHGPGTPCFDKIWETNSKVQQGYATAQALMTSATNSKEVHPTCLVFMGLLKHTLELVTKLACRIPISSRHCSIGSVFRGGHVRREKVVDMFRVVMVSCAGAHIVCIWVYLTMNNWGGEGT